MTDKKVVSIKADNVTFTCVDNHGILCVHEILDSGGSMIRFTGIEEINPSIPTDLELNIRINASQDGATKTQHPYFGETFQETQSLQLEGGAYLGALLATHLNAAAKLLATEHRDYTVEQIFEAYHDKFKASERLRDLNLRALMQQEKENDQQP